MPNECGPACGSAAVSLRFCGNSGVAVLSSIGEPHTHHTSPHSNRPATADRWRIVVALLRSPEREGYRLAALLEKLPGERRRHLAADDCRRRPGRENSSG